MSVEAMAWALRDAPDVPTHAAMALMGLANHADHEGRGAYPSQDVLAGYARKKVRQIRRDLADLEEVGLIRKGDQRLVAHLAADRRPVVWDLAMERRASLAATEDPTTGHTRPGGRTRPVVDDRAVTGDRAVVQGTSAGGNGRSSTTGRSSETKRPVVHDLQTINEPSSKEVTTTADANGTRKRGSKRPPADAVAARFDEFWSSYPRRQDIGPAEKAWTRAIDDLHTDPQLVIDAARLYAMQRKGQDPQYTKLPATWLNARCWLDDPAPAYGSADGMLPGFEAEARPALPPWCGSCGGGADAARVNPRFRTDTGHPAGTPCPRCHPDTQKATTP